ncbi:MAG: non-homologous end-joining DNA ligase [Actinomycetota bacterium]
MIDAGAAGTPPARDVEIGGRVLRLTNLDRVLWPRTGFTKGDMIAYYRSVADRVVEYVRDRPLTLGRFPTGVEGRGWAQTECRGAPAWMTTADVRLRTGHLRHYCVVNDEASLVWVANQGVIELHPFLWRTTEPDRATEVVFDLDPGPDVGVEEACAVALRVREHLAAHDLDAWAKTTGALGLHVHAPLERGADFDATKGLARDVAASLTREDPTAITDRMTRSLRTGKVFIDWAQNDRRRSLIAPWSLRATPVPAAATPMSWAEVVARARGEWV